MTRVSVLLDYLFNRWHNTDNRYPIYKPSKLGTENRSLQTIILIPRLRLSKTHSSYIILLLFFLFSSPIILFNVPANIRVVCPPKSAYFRILHYARARVYKREYPLFSLIFPFLFMCRKRSLCVYDCNKKERSLLLRG